MTALANAEKAEIISLSRKITERGWCSHGARNIYGQGCMVTNLESAMKLAGFANEAPVLDQVAMVLEEMVPEMVDWFSGISPLSKLAHYNDFHATHQDVLDLHDKALAELGALP